MECAILVTNIMLIIVSIGVFYATIKSIETSKATQNEMWRQRFARYKTIVLYYVRICSDKDKFETDKDAFRRFMLIAITKVDKKFFQNIIKEYNIEDSEEFLRYICDVCDDADYQYETHTFLIR